MNRRRELSDQRLDDAARAGWLYYVAGNTQDDIALKPGVSRQTAQRLVSLAVSEGLIRVRLEHPIAPRLSGALKNASSSVIPAKAGTHATIDDSTSKMQCHQGFATFSPLPTVVGPGLRQDDETAVGSSEQVRG